MSLLLSQGHPAAWKYPLARVWTEAYLVQERINRQLASEANLTFLAFSTVAGSMFAKKQDANKNIVSFQKILESLSNG